MRKVPFGTTIAYGLPGLGAGYMWHPRPAGGQKRNEFGSDKSAGAANGDVHRVSLAKSGMGSQIGDSATMPKMEHSSQQVVNKCASQTRSDRPTG